jgi:DivIVA domain-containing protein
MPLTPEAVKSRQFTSSRFGRHGYDEEEVDAFLDEVEEELRRLLTENAELRAQLAATAGGAAPGVEGAADGRRMVTAGVGVSAGERPEEAALRTLMLAQKTADEVVSSARTDADQVLAEARQRADQTLGDARAQAEKVQREARESYAATVGELERKRASLQQQVDDLRAFEREYRARLRAFLEDQLSQITGRAVPPVAEPAPAAQAHPDAADEAVPEPVGSPVPAEFMPGNA